MIIVRLTTQVDPIATPKSEAAIQKVHIGSGMAAIATATASSTAMITKVRFEPNPLLMKLNTIAPMMLNSVAHHEDDEEGTRLKSDDRRGIGLHHCRLQ